MSSQVIWITGASQGIGRALALALAEAGEQVIASARSAEPLKTLSEEAGDLPGSIVALPLDVTCKEAVGRAVEQIVSDYARLDQVVLNAGTFLPMRGADFKADIVRQQLELNVMGVCYCLEPVIALMKRQGRGVIAINASLSGYRGLPKASAYGASKAALINMAECLRIELADTGVDIKIINPGFVKTPLTDKNTFPMPFLVPAERAGKYIARGLNRSGFEITFPFVFASILKLLRVLPYRIYFFLAKRLLG